MKLTEMKLVMTVLAVLFSLNAYAYDVEIDGIYYDLDADAKTATVTHSECEEYTGSYTGAISIPSIVTYNGEEYTVTTIGDFAFTYSEGLTAVTIPNSVISLGASAFARTGLTSVIIPNSITSLPNEAFRCCLSLTSVTIPNSVTIIGGHAFQECQNLPSVTIPENVTYIGECAFENCPALTSLTIPNSVTYIGDWAFSTRTYGNISSLSIPSSVTYIGDNAFTDMWGLTSIEVEEGNLYYDSRDNCHAIIRTADNVLICGCSETTIPNGISAIASGAFKGCGGLTAVNIPNGVTSIGDEAFADCWDLASINIPNSVTSIGSRVFSQCYSLTSPVYNSTFFVCLPKTYEGDYAIPEGITTICDESFRDCTGLNSVTIPSSVTSIGSWVFDGCSNLTSLTIPQGVTSIGPGLSCGCDNLNSIHVAKGNTLYDSRDNCNAVIEKSSNMLISGCRNTIIPNSVTSIGYSAFKGCHYLTSIDIPNSVTAINDESFRGSGLTSVTIPNSVTFIDVPAFWECDHLTTVISEMENPFTIDEPVFPYSCTLIIPDGTKDAYIAAGYRDDMFEGGICEWDAKDNNLSISDMQIRKGKNYILPVSMSNVLSITAMQFDITLPDGVSIAKNAKDKYIVEKTGRCADHTLTTGRPGEENVYKVILFSNEVAEITGNSGAVLNITLEVADDMEEGEYDVTISNINLTTPSESKIKPANAKCVLTVKNSIPGDANGDGEVDVTDVVSIVNCILGKPSASFDAAAADVNGDGEIDVTDIVAVVNIILGKGNHAKAREMEVLSNALTMLSEKDGMNILVERAAQFAAMQFDVAVSDNTTLLDATLNSSSDHQISFAKIDANRYRVIAFSMDNESFEPTEDALIRLALNGTATIENATFVAADGRSMVMNITGDATGIAEISSKSQEGFIYNLAGQRMGTSTKSLSTGVYIRNGKRILVK